jgi:hypothetical protein
MGISLKLSGAVDLSNSQLSGHLTPLSKRFSGVIDTVMSKLTMSIAPVSKFYNFCKALIFLKGTTNQIQAGVNFTTKGLSGNSLLNRVI